MFAMTKQILGAYYSDECDLYLVYGMPEGIGKSTLTIKVLAEIKGRPKPQLVDEWPLDYEQVKTRVKFYPEDVVDLCKELTDKGRREEAFIWDDAGLWLNAMEWNDPFVIAFTKYLNIARTNWAAIILTTPVPEWVLKKFRTSEGLIFVKITKVPGAKTYKGRIREARAYRRWIHPDRTKHGVRSLFNMVYDASLPNDFYYDWYKPLRDSYAKAAVNQMFMALEKKKKRGFTTGRDEITLDSVKEHIADANDASKDFKEAINSTRD